jgi:hypothetical protein
VGGAAPDFSVYPRGLAVGYDDSIVLTFENELVRFSPQGKLDWRVALEGVEVVSAPLVDRAGVVYLRATQEEPPGAYVVAFDPGGRERWRVHLGFNRAARGLGVLPDGRFVFRSVQVAMHTPMHGPNDIRIYYESVDPELCTLTRGGALSCRQLPRPWERRRPEWPDAEATPPDGSGRLPW